MEAKQMTLFSVEEALVRMDEIMDERHPLDSADRVCAWTLPATETYLEEAMTIEDAWEVARAYGRETARRYHAVPMIRRRVSTFVAGIAEANGFDDVQEEHLIAVAMTYADAELQD